MTLAPKNAQMKSFNFEVVAVNRRGEEIKRETKQAQYFTEELGNGVTLELVAIGGGSFLMGSLLGEGFDDEKPQHQVNVPSFFMSKYPVTQAQWRSVAAMPKVERDLKLAPAHFPGDSLPVECVSWYDAVEFCARLSQKRGREYRLPSEAEWEYACRAGTTTAFHFGETITSALANYNGSRTYASEASGEWREQTTRVGSFAANAFGLYDLHGNVFEWCADNWNENYEGAPSDGKAWLNEKNKDYRPVRGGSWDYLGEGCRSACRSYICPDIDINISIGFRVVCSAARTP